MELKGSKTEQNLWEAFAGESQARNKYILKTIIEHLLFACPIKEMNCFV